MTDLPRSRALVRLDGPGHIMPVEPVTPPDSTLWRLIHQPLMLAAIAVVLLFVTAVAINPVGLGFRMVTHIPGVRYLLPPVGAAATIALYCMFVRIVERRPDIAELDPVGSAGELGLGYGGGLVLSLVTFAILALLGGLRVVGFNSPHVMLSPFINQLCTAVLLELIVCGLGFRLVERWLGSWLTLLLTMMFFAVMRTFADDVTLFAMAAVALEAGLLFAALYMLTRRLWAAMGLHAGWRFAQIGLYGVAMSDTGPHGLVVSILDGPDWLTGGGAGTDTSAPALVVNGAFLLGLLAMTVRRGRVVRPVWQRGR